MELNTRKSRRGTFFSFVVFSFKIIYNLLIIGGFMNTEEYKYTGPRCGN
jgi:hypothetical protein